MMVGVSTIVELSDPRFSRAAEITRYAGDTPEHFL